MQSRTWYDREGDIVHRYTLEPSGRLTRERLGAGKSAIIEHNKRRQLEPDATKSMDWGRLAVQLPENEYQRLLATKPELSCWDKDVRSKAWDKWLQSEESRPYRVRERI